MTATVVGPLTWSLKRDNERHRTYEVVHRVRAATTDGPYIVLKASGIPTVGSIWSFDSDLDANAYCYPDADVTPEQPKEGDPTQFWQVKQVFSTKPLDQCQTSEFTNPVLEPDKVSGGSTKYTQEVAVDKDNNPILTSSHELIKGPLVEFDHNRPTVRIEQNVSNLELEVITDYVDKLNDATLWGLPARTVKLSNVTWRRRLFGVCNFYYTRNFEFDIDYTTFDRKALDEGTMVLNGEWDTSTGQYVVKDVASGVAADKDNPNHFIRYQDMKGQNARVVLNGEGLPSDIVAAIGTGTGTTGGPGDIDIQYYGERNFLNLSIPTSF